MPPAARSVSTRVFLTCWVVYSFFWTPYIVREHFPAVALAEQGTLNVERYLGWTEDIFSGPQGGAFINNNPGASVTGAIPLLLFRPLLVRVDKWNRTGSRPDRQRQDGEVFWRTLEEGRGFYFLLVAFMTVALVMAPLTAGTAGYLCSRLIAAGVPAASAAACALIYGLGTPLMFRVGHLNHNLLAGDAGFTALLLLWDPENRPLPTVRAASAGMLAGYAMFCDYSAVVIVAIGAFYVWLRSGNKPAVERSRLLGAYGAGLVPFLSALALYQAWAFGSLYRPSQHYMVAIAPTAHGYRGFDWPSPALAWANFFDPRFGLFAFCPALVLAFYAPFQKSARYRAPRQETRILFAYFLLFVLFCSANRYSWLQPLTGFRYLVPVVPALALLSLQAGQALRPFLRRALALASCAQSVLMAWAHENDIRLFLPALLNRHFEPQWMIRLGRAGAPVRWWWTPTWIITLAACLTIIWMFPGQRDVNWTLADE